MPRRLQASAFKIYNMGIINIVENVKKIHPEYVVFVNIGKFYYTYGRDSYIISYLFNYKLNKFDNISRCGFSDNSINKVIAKLEQNKINYIVLDRKNNYDVVNKLNNKNLNNYNKIFEKSKININLKKRIDNINMYLYSNLNNSQINKILTNMEKIINERRKI